MSAGALCRFHLDLRGSPPSTSVTLQSDGSIRRLNVESMSYALRSRESNASKLDSDSSVGEIVAERGTTVVVIWRLGNLGDWGDFGRLSSSKGSGAGFRTRMGMFSRPIPASSLGRSWITV